MEKHIANKVATREIKPADCPRRSGHRALVGTSEPCEGCGVIVPAGPFDHAGWAGFGIKTLTAPPSAAIAPSEGERQAETEYTRAWTVYIEALREANALRAAAESERDGTKALDLRAQAERLEGVAEQHREAAAAARRRTGELEMERDRAWRRSLGR